MEIENGIPIPPRGGSLGRPRTQHGEDARKLKVRQSLWFEDHGRADTARTTIYKLGGKSQMRKMKHETTGVMGWRVWRVA